MAACSAGSPPANAALSLRAGTVLSQQQLSTMPCVPHSICERRVQHRVTWITFSRQQQVQLLESLTARPTSAQGPVVKPLGLPPLKRPSKLSDVHCSAKSSTDSSSTSISDGKDESPSVLYFQVANKPRGHVVAIGFDEKTQTIDLKTLVVVAESEVPYVEVLHSSGGVWVAFTGKLSGAAKFWGKGTSVAPYVLRRPYVPPYTDRVAVAQTSPSSMTSSYLRTEQRVNSRGANILGEEEARLIFNHRPETVAALPASLVYPGFGRFIDGLKPGAVSLTKEDYEAAATLCSVGHRLFVDQGARGDALNKVLSDYLGKTIRQTEVEACFPDGETTNYYTDGSIIASTEAGDYLLLNCKYGNEGGEVYFHNQWFYKTFWGHQLDSRLLHSTPAPAFLLDQPGPLFRVVAAFFMGHLQAEPLTPAINLLSLERFNLDQMEYLARTLHNLKREVKALEVFVKKAEASGESQARDAYLKLNLPYPFFTQIDGNRSICERVQDVKRPRFLTTGQRIWTGVLDTGEKVLMKFAQSYGRAIHEAWAAKGFAPRLYECQRLPGGFYLIVMEYLSEEDYWISMASLDDRGRLDVLPLVERRLKQAHAIDVDGFGARGVLGDCRDQNVMLQCKKESLENPLGPGPRDVVDVRFIDFDWAGVAGVKRYPPFMNTRQVSWPDGAETGRLIKVWHDQALLKSGGYIWLAVA